MVDRDPIRIAEIFRASVNQANLGLRKAENPGTVAIPEVPDPNVSRFFTARNYTVVCLLFPTATSVLTDKACQIDLAHTIERYLVEGRAGFLKIGWKLACHSPKAGCLCELENSVSGDCPYTPIGSVKAPLYRPWTSRRGLNEYALSILSEVALLQYKFL